MASWAVGGTLYLPFIIWTIAGSCITVLTVWFPEWITPLSDFVLGPSNGIYIYFRALFGMVCTALIGITVTLFTEPADEAHYKGLTADTLDEAMETYKGGKPNHKVGEKIKGLQVKIDESLGEKIVSVTENVKKLMKAEEGDIIYLSDDRWWLGGLRSEHVKLGPCHQGADEDVHCSTHTKDLAYLLDGRTAFVEKII